MYSLCNSDSLARILNSGGKKNVQKIAKIKFSRAFLNLLYFFMKHVNKEQRRIHPFELVTMRDHYLKLPQRAHDIRMTSYQRRCDVKTSHRRRSDVILTSCACWDIQYHALFPFECLFFSAFKESNHYILSK